MDSLLVCLPPSGAGRSFYRGWPRRVGEARVLPLSRPGSEERLREPAAPSVVMAAADVAAKVPARASGRVVLFGHSLGAAVAFEAARLLHADALVVSARQAPQLPGRASSLAAQGDEELLAWTGADVSEESVRDLLLPRLRADLALSAGHRWDGGLLAAPVLGVSWDDDPVVSEPEVRAWAATTSAGYRHLSLPGGHAGAADPPTSLIAALERLLDEPRPLDVSD